MYFGNITSVLSSDPQRAGKIAEKLGKLHENAKVNIYYRRNGDYIRSILVATQYPEKLLCLAEAVSLSSRVILNVPDSPKWTDGELGLLADSSGAKVVITSDLSEDKVRKMFKGIGLEGSEITQGVNDVPEGEEKDKGFIYVDKAFNVKGVGTVVTGFSFTPAELHEKLNAVPVNKEVEVKTIQVLDEDQKGVKPGVRIGFSLRNAKEEEMRDTYILVKPSVPLIKEFEAELVSYPWSKPTDGNYHVVGGGVAVTATLKVNEGNAQVSLTSPLPKLERYILLNVNVKQGKPRVIGYLKPK
ncbi:translation elongation factor [Sulfuracidifex metallicus]|uniref:translation elongation factor n=1 Tax=Sulfuracidifex metallicus TaxID=47303 RepID=UPI002272A4A7|nr:translation elongation factor [Sulfuracidifex metallicus]MCY0850067.1 translation elongation factor [Sulfuracidifex metallicus]